jgi:hypothetical protein
VSANHLANFNYFPGEIKRYTKKKWKKGSWAEARGDYRASETMICRLDWDWEYLSLVRLDESFFLDLVELLAQLSLFLANLASPDFLPLEV